MRLCLVIPGGVDTKNTVCRVVEDMGFVSAGVEDGLYSYTGDDDGSLDIVVLDWEQPGLEGENLKDRLKKLRQERESVILFCRQGEEKEYLEQLLGSDGEDDWQLRAFSIDDLASGAGAE